MRPRISISGFVRPLDRWSVGPSVMVIKLEMWKRAFPPLPTRPQLVLAVIFSSFFARLPANRKAKIRNKGEAIVFDQKWTPAIKNERWDPIWLEFSFVTLICIMQFFLMCTSQSYIKKILPCDFLALTNVYISIFEYIFTSYRISIFSFTLR